MASPFRGRPHGLLARLPRWGLRLVERPYAAWAKYSGNLNVLATIHATDKWNDHWYTQHYQRYFAFLRRRPINLLEIGVGGYGEEEVGGESLRMWRAYFRRGRIVGIDLFDRTHLCADRIDVRQCDQTDGKRLQALSEEYGGFDIVIDDGSHLNEHVIATFKILFPLLRPNGFYAVEDTQTAYWPGWGGGIGNPESSMAFFKGLADGLNHVEYPLDDYEPSYFDLNITEVAFFHNTIMVRKGSNDERSNAPQELLKEIELARSTAVKANT